LNSRMHVYGVCTSSVRDREMESHCDAIQLIDVIRHTDTYICAKADRPYSTAVEAVKPAMPNPMPAQSFGTMPMVGQRL